MSDIVTPGDESWDQHQRRVGQVWTGPEPTAKTDHANSSTPRPYNVIVEQIYSVLLRELSWLANAANVVPVIYRRLPNLNWVGFYYVVGNKLELGPCNGGPACGSLPFGNGVCGTVAKTGRLLNVADVTKFDGHITCDPTSKSELVVPLFDKGKVIGVLDLDSPILGRFNEIDEKGCTNIARLLTEWQKDNKNVYPLLSRSVYPISHNVIPFIRRTVAERIPLSYNDGMEETAEFRAVAKQEGLSTVELRRIIDKAGIERAAKGELTARETDHTTEPLRPNDAATETTTPAPLSLDAATARALAGLELLRKQTDLALSNPALPESERARKARQLVRAFERLHGRIEMDTPPEVKAARRFLTPYNQRMKASKVAKMAAPL